MRVLGILRDDDEPQFGCRLRDKTIRRYAKRSLAFRVVGTGQVVKPAKIQNILRPSRKATVNERDGCECQVNKATRATFLVDGNKVVRPSANL